MNLLEIIIGSILAVFLIVVAGYFIWRQKKTLHMTADDSWNEEDRLYMRQQIKRRLWISVLLLIFAFILIGSFFLDLARPGDEADQHGVTTEQKEYAWSVTVYWGMALVILFLILVLAARDIVAIGKFAYRKQRQLESDRKAILAEHVALLRKQRNGDK